MRLKNRSNSNHGVALAALLLLALPAAVAAAQSTDADAGEILVVGFKNPYKLTHKELGGALAAYQKGRMTYAPDSGLYFEVKSSGGETLTGLQLSLAAGDESIPVELDGQNRFVLPALPGGDWELKANRRRGGLIVKPLVLSPGTNEADRLLGDMRLQCEVTWAIERHHVSVFARGAFNAAGGCRSSKFAIYSRSERPLAGATVTSGAIMKPIQILRDRHLFRVPLHDKTLPHTARVRLQYM
jgi:hypothetical protein